MAIQFTTTVEGHTLVVKASGFDEGVSQMEQYGLAIVDLCRQNGVTHVLCDERHLDYRLSTIDTYRSAEHIARLAPRVARVAIVCDPRNVGEAQFWEAVAANRGLTVRVFHDMAAAIHWLHHPECEGQMPDSRTHPADRGGAGLGLGL